MSKKHPRPFSKKHPPIWGTLNLEQFEKLVDHRSFPRCDSCDQPIYNPQFYKCVGMCGPCTTGEAATLMIHEEDVDWADYADMPDFIPPKKTK